jgi:hypothetical protein
VYLLDMGTQWSAASGDGADAEPFEGAGAADDEADADGVIAACCCTGAAASDFSGAAA